MRRIMRPGPDVTFRAPPQTAWTRPWGGSRPSYFPLRGTSWRAPPWRRWPGWRAGWYPVPWGSGWWDYVPWDPLGGPPDDTWRSPWDDPLADPRAGAPPLPWDNAPLPEPNIASADVADEE